MSVLGRVAGSPEKARLGRLGLRARSARGSGGAAGEPLPTLPAAAPGRPRRRTPSLGRWGRRAGWISLGRGGGAGQGSGGGGPSPSRRGAPVAILPSAGARPLVNGGSRPPEPAAGEQPAGRGPPGRPTCSLRSGGPHGGRAEVEAGYGTDGRRAESRGSLQARRSSTLSNVSPTAAAAPGCAHWREREGENHSLQTNKQTKKKKKKKKKKLQFPTPPPGGGGRGGPHLARGGGLLHGQASPTAAATPGCARRQRGEEKVKKGDKVLFPPPHPPPPGCEGGEGVLILSGEGSSRLGQAPFEAPAHSPGALSSRISLS